jgi:hypothetical protein
MPPYVIGTSDLARVTDAIRAVAGVA